MINVKDQIYAALSAELPNVSDTHPKTWEAIPCVQYMEEENNVFEWGDTKEYKSYCRYRVDIWDNVSTSAAALKVDRVMAGLGLVRKQCMDVDDPSGLKHKMMRYDMVIDNLTEEVYQAE